MAVSLTIDSAGTFLRVGNVETYARRDRAAPRSWAFIREPGAWEMEAGRFRLTVSWAPKPGEAP
ncbi:hypothetical protein AAFN86_28760 [Roseomonas sp. CAU 1739]|uniref:hypothetical protein n=1 Tax=Roseomonas sp. CAU 1739 TaxID=3140364 RepID=UPI00325AD1E3